ncbi:MAG: ribonuclease HIII [Clostridiales bacterium]|nr:ribonuclease HIII [Clostridiales bacterium]
MNVVIKVDEETKQKMIDYYKDKIRDKKIPYAIFQAVEEDTVITLYESGKAMFQGISADVDASMWAMLQEKGKEDLKNEEDLYNITSIGSDEVGTGDYFGPVVVCAAYVNIEDIKFLEELKVKDSKQITDDYIRKIAPTIAKKIDYELLALSNKEYNEKYKTIKNINKIKAIMHNKVLYTLHQRHSDCNKIIIDEFAKENSYFNYLKEVTNVERNLIFTPKAENKNMAVATAAILARFTFLEIMDKLSDKYHEPLLKGASSEVDKQAERLIEKYGKEVLDDIAKLHFINTERILKTRI